MLYNTFICYIMICCYIIVSVYYMACYIALYVTYCAGVSRGYIVILY